MLPGEAGEIAGILLFTLGIVLWVLIPFYDTSKESGRRGRAAHYFGLMAVSCAAGHDGHWVLDDSVRKQFSNGCQLSADLRCNRLCN